MSKRIIIVLLLLLLLRMLRSEKSIHHRRRALILAVNLFLMTRDDGVLDVSELLLLLLLLLELVLALLLLILLGEFLHEVRDDDGRRSGTPNEAMNEDLAVVMVSVVDGFVDERKRLVERSLDVLADGVTEVDLLGLDAVTRQNGIGEVALVGDVEDVEDAAGDELGSVHGIHGGTEIDTRMDERGVEVVATSLLLLLFQLPVGCHGSKLEVGRLLRLR